MHHLHRAADHLVARNILAGLEDIAGSVIAVDVRGNEIERNIVLDGMLDHGISPSRLRRGRPADPEPLVDGLNGASGVVIQFEVGFLLGTAGPEVDVGLVPYFEIPRRYFVDPITLDQ